MLVAMHQPNFIPYLGFFDKMLRADAFVIRDEVLFVNKDFHQRNRIRINGNNNLNNPQSKWIKVPVIEKPDYIRDIEIRKGALSGGRQWNLQVLHDIEASYKGAGFFEKYYPKLKDILLEPDNRLIDLNLRIIRFLMESFNIDKEIVIASSLGLKDEGYAKTDASEDIVKICKAVGADSYLSGAGGKNYLNCEPFQREGVELQFQEYIHPRYDQRFPGFLPFMCAIDALFCVGRYPEDKDDNNDRSNTAWQTRKAYA